MKSQEENVPTYVESRNRKWELSRPWEVFLSPICFLFLFHFFPSCSLAFPTS